MKFKLPRQNLTKEIKEIINREVRRQKLVVPRATRQYLRELAEITKWVKKSGLPAHLVCKKLPEKLGHGIFLAPDAKPILKDTVIGAYSGEVSLVPQNAEDDGSYAFTPVEDILLSKEEQQRYDKKRPYRSNRLYALKVDALKKGNFTRFINHSEKPNVIAHLYAIPANPFGLAPASIEVIYFAKKTIHPGEQLLVCYEDGEESYWGAMKIKPFPMTPKTFRMSTLAIS